MVLRRSDKLRLFLEANTERFHDVVQQCKDVAASRKRSLKSGFMQGLKKFGGLFRKKQEGDVARMTQGEEDAVGYVSAAKKSVNNFFKKTASVAKAQSSSVYLYLGMWLSRLCFSCGSVLPPCISHHQEWPWAWRNWPPP